MSTNEEQKQPTLADQITSKPPKEEGIENKPKREMSLRDKLRKKKQAEKVKDSNFKEKGKEQENNLNSKPGQEQPPSISVEKKENEINSTKKDELILLNDKINKDNLDKKNEEIKNEEKIVEPVKNEEISEKKISEGEKEKIVKDNIGLKINIEENNTKLNEENNNEYRKADTITDLLMKNWNF